MNTENNANNSHHKYRDELTKKNTLTLIASIVATPDFPQKEHVPQTIPIPFTNFGHQPIIDHELLQSELWRIITIIQKTLLPWKRFHSLLIISNILLSLLLFIFSLIVFNSILGGIVISVISIILGGLFISHRTDNYRKIFAEVKAKELQNLISENYKYDYKISETDKIKNRMKYFGNGELESENVPVLTIIKNNNPFPGFGRLQLENVFVCRPQSTESSINHPQEKIGEIVNKKVVEVVKSVNNGDISSGEVVTLYGSSILMNSNWLNSDKSPILWIPKKNLTNFLKNNDDASFRLYYTINTVFPAYNATSTFFFRIFYAGNSVACHIVLSTIGPPIHNKQKIQKVLLGYKLEKEELRETKLEHDNNDNDKVQKQNGIFIKLIKSFINSLLPTTKNKKQKEDEEKEPHALLTAVKAIRILTKKFDKFIKPDINISDILDLNFDDEEIPEEEKNEFNKEFNTIIEQSTMWPGGIATQNLNIRDLNSYSFVTDFFGKPELTASIRTMYDQVSRTILEAFDELGFSISDYRDSEGNYTINAEKIDNLVMAEKINSVNLEKKEQADKVKDNQ